jgi:hypothetical protein
MNEVNKGLQPIYEGLQNSGMEKKEAELIETINNILYHEKDTKLINRKTKLTDNYSMPTLDTLSFHLNKKYGKDSDIICGIVDIWSRSHKDVSVSMNGWLISSILDTFKGFIEAIKQRSLGEKLTGQNKDVNK